jgi:hypothetical protein
MDATMDDTVTSGVPYGMSRGESTIRIHDDDAREHVTVGCYTVYLGTVEYESGHPISERSSLCCFELPSHHRSTKHLLLLS